MTKISISIHGMLLDGVTLAKLNACQDPQVRKFAVYFSSLDLILLGADD